MDFHNCAHFLHYMNLWRIQAEETMQKANENNTHDEVACIANSGAAARCALGLLVVVVLLLSY